MKRRADGRFVKKITLPDGTVKYLYSTANSEREAVKDFNKQMMRLEDETIQSQKFEKVAAKWKELYRERNTDINFRKSISASYERTIQYFANEMITEIDAADVSAFLSWLQLQQFSYKTVASHKSVLNMVFKNAIANRYVKDNPVKNAEMPANLPRKKRTLPNDDELAIVNAHYEGFDFLPYFLLNTGLRMSEALPIEVEKDIDFVNKTIVVNKHLIHDGNKPVIEQVTKTDDSERTVILLDRVAEKIKKKKGFLFSNEDGSPLTKKQLQCRWDNYKKKYNVDVTAHQLRHGYATMLFEAGIDEKDAQELMGHSDITLTRQIYTHIRSKRKEETARKLNNFSF